MNTPCVSGFFGVSLAGNDGFPHLSGGLGRGGVGVGEQGRARWGGMRRPAWVDGSSQWGRGPFFGVLSVGVSADVCVIGLLVEIVVQQPHNRITRQATPHSPNSQPSSQLPSPGEVSEHAVFFWFFRRVPGWK